MRAIDWVELLREHNIPYITSGANVKRGEVSIQCPFCGSADPSKHMGLNLETGWWSCWRNRSQHSGKSPLRLIMRLLNVPYYRARQIAGLGDDYVDPEGFDAIAARVLGRGQETARPGTVERRFLVMERDFQPLTSKIRTRRHWNYLFGARGFNRMADDPDKLAEQYGLMAGVRGKWEDRIILPYYQDGELMTWTGRAIADAMIRYKDLSIDESIRPPKETLYNFDCLREGGKVLVLLEGPFDVLKIDFYAKRFGVRAVGLSTNSIKETQAYLLQAAGDAFDQTIIMMDNATQLGIIDSIKMKHDLFFIKNISTAPVPFGSKDAGALTPAQVIEWARNL
jgi:hypothetical protein